MKQKLLFSMGLLLVVLLTACATPTPMAIPTFTPTATATIPPTSTPTPTPTPLPDPEWSFFKKVDTVNVEVKDIRKLAFDQDGYLWAIGYGGVMRWNLENKTRVAYTESDGLSGDKLRSILVDKHNVPWVASDTEIFSFDGETWVSYPYPSTGWTRSFFEGANNDLWLCAPDGLHQFNGTEWITHGVHNGMPAEKCYDLAIDADGYPWVISADNTLSHYTGQWENIETPTNLVELYEDVVDYLSKIHISPTGEVWIEGLFHVSNVNMAQHTWNLYALPEREGVITAFAFSASGTPWVAHLYKGKTSFRAFNGTDWPIIMQSGYENGLDMTFDTAISDPDGAIWFIGEECFIRTMQHGWTVFNDAHAAWNPIHNHGVFSTDGTLYFSAVEGILALGEHWEDMSTVKEKVEGLESNKIRKLQIDADGNVYIIYGDYPEEGLGNLVKVFDGSSWETAYEFPQGGKAWNVIWDILVIQDGTFWVMTDKRVGKSLFHFDSAEMIAKDPISPYGANYVKGVFEDDQKAIWVVSNWGSLYMWDGEQWKTFELEDNITKFHLSPQGIQWLEVRESYKGYGSTYYRWLVTFQDGNLNNIYGPEQQRELFFDGWILDVQFNQHDQPIVLFNEDDPKKEPVLYEYNGHSWNHIDVNMSEITTIFYHRDTLWVGTVKNGVYYRVDSEDGIGEWEHLSHSNWDGGTYVRLIAAGIDDDIWVATQESINLFRDGEWIYFPQGENGFIDVTCFAIAPDGSVWLGSYSQGVARYGRP